MKTPAALKKLIAVFRILYCEQNRRQGILRTVDDLKPDQLNFWGKIVERESQLKYYASGHTEATFKLLRQRFLTKTPRTCTRESNLWEMSTCWHPSVGIDYGIAP